MSRFNQTAPTTTKTTNLAGGVAYTQTPELELVSLLLTSFANDTFYEKAETKFDRLKKLIGECDKQFAAKAIVYARIKFGMRSITHVAASELAKHVTGQDWAKGFFSSVVYRVDDMSEILSYHFSKKEKMSAAMKKGFAKAFDKFDQYSLAKYRSEGKQVKLVDIVNLVKPVATDRNAEALRLLVKNELKSVDTWESKLSSAGKVARSEDEKVELKGKAWADMISSKQLKYMALVKNLRNIIEQAPNSVPAAVQMLVDPAEIKKSLLLPFRFLTAYEEIEKLGAGQVVRAVLIGLSKALEISVSNVPVFEGNTLVVLDTSSSMRGYHGQMGNKSPHIIGSIFAAALVKANNCDMMTFDTDARYVKFNPLDTLHTIAHKMVFNGGGTNFLSIFQSMTQKYDRIIILSDMQGWMNTQHWYGVTPNAALNHYKERFKVNPFLYSFDLQNYGSMQFPESNVFCVAGFSDKVFDIMKLLETDKKALINEINKINL